MRTLNRYARPRAPAPDPDVALAERHAALQRTNPPAAAAVYLANLAAITRGRDKLAPPPPPAPVAADPDAGLSPSMRAARVLDRFVALTSATPPKETP